MSTTKTIVIDEVAALDALRKTVEKYGSERRLSGDCTYTRPVDGWSDFADDEYETPDYDNIVPSCILGCAFHEVLQVPLDVLRQMDSLWMGRYCPGGSETITAKEVKAVLSYNGIELAPAALDVFEVAQKVQDKGDSWGYALAKAEAYAEKLRNGEVA